MMKLDFAVGRTVLKIYILLWEEEKRGDFDDWMRPSKKKTRKGRKEKRKTKRTMTILETPS